MGIPVPVQLGRRRAVGLVLGPLLFAVLVTSPVPAGLDAPAWRTAAVAVLMAVWWITEAIPIPATALLPIALFPILGVAPVEGAAAPYANSVIYLFLGGFLLAAGMQRWGLHRRVALRVLRSVGFGPTRIVGGFMAATALVSLWVSNTATTAMMYPIGLSVMQLVRGGGNGRGGPSNFETCLMLGIAYAASIGGLGTLIGTPPNALLAGFFSETYGVEIGFARWMIVGIPLVALMLPLAWFILVRVVYPLRPGDLGDARERLEHETGRLGPLGRGEARMAGVVVVTALAWMLQPLLARWVPGLSDAGIAIGAGIALFLVPVEPRRGVFLLDWGAASKLPWDVLVLFGGGLSLADAIHRTGLSRWIGAALGGLDALPAVALVGCVVLAMIFLTELTSNTASAASFLPVIAALAVGIGESPLLLAVPMVVAASCAFMLPVATPPNAIVFASGAVPIGRMARAGLVLNLVFTVLITAATWLLLPVAFGVRPGVLPPWAAAPTPPAGG
jgi:sodium-dependent dicarboxylate transporter 2/3/5